MPLGEVAPGMRCTGHSVIRGTEIVPFDVEVLDVIQGEQGDAVERILVRVSGPDVPAGIGPGFSGSPVYCPDADGTPRVIGAMSEGIAEYGNDVGLPTPIEAILGVPIDPPTGARPATAAERAARPLRAPLAFSGLAPSVAALVRRAPRAAAARDRGPGPAARRAVPAADARAGLRVRDRAHERRPRARRDRHRHLRRRRPPLGLRPSRSTAPAGARSSSRTPTSTRWSTTRSARRTCRRYKLAAPGHDLGTLTNDEQSAVAGRTGPLPRHFPLRVTARNCGRVRPGRW